VISSEIACAVLNGGKSSRFGSPKASARIGGISLLERALNLAVLVSPEVLIAGKQPSGTFPQGIKIIPDQFENSGPASGIVSALGTITKQWLAVLPVDMPFLTQNIYQALFEQRLGQQIIVARSRYGLEPLVSLWNRDSFPALQFWLKSGKRSLQHLLNSGDANLKVREIEFKSDDFYNPVNCFKNINFASDISEILSLETD